MLCFVKGFTYVKYDLQNNLFTIGTLVFLFYTEVTEAQTCRAPFLSSQRE